MNEPGSACRQVPTNPAPVLQRFDGRTQTTSSVMVVPPLAFRFDEETAQSNPFQKRPEELRMQDADIQKRALREFRTFVETLRGGGIHVVELPGEGDATASPDAVFPNNWFSLHQGQDGAPVLVLYPMAAKIRRCERQPAAVRELLSRAGLDPCTTVDCTEWETAGTFLEGTGSLVLDRVGGMAYAAVSPRTHERAVALWCSITGYSSTLFHAVDGQGIPIYHTNVVMGIGTDFAVVCTDAIRDPEERKIVTGTLEATGRDVIPITLAEMYSFAGNLLELQGSDGTAKIVLSSSAWNALSQERQARLAAHGEILPVHIPVIEGIGGGSARCMIAEVFPSIRSSH